MDRSRINFQNTAWGAEQMTVVWRNFEYLLESVSCERTNGFEKRQKNLRKNQCGQAEKSIENFVWKNKQKLRFERVMSVWRDFKSGYSSAPVSWVRVDGSEQESGVQWKWWRTGSRQHVKTQQLGAGAVVFLPQSAGERLTAATSSPVIGRLRKLRIRVVISGPEVEEYGI